MELVHKVVNTVNKSVEDECYCVVVLLDVSQTFHKVWHQGLLHKIKKVDHNS